MMTGYFISQQNFNKMELIKATFIRQISNGNTFSMVDVEQYSNGLLIREEDEFGVMETFIPHGDWEIKEYSVMDMCHQEYVPSDDQDWDSMMNDYLTENND